MKTIILSAIESKTSGALSAALCLLLGPAAFMGDGEGKPQDE
jgi:nicotinamide mononucleotide (NMN) deamidase PncC